MPHLPLGGYPLQTLALPVRVLGFHQVCASGLPTGVAQALCVEALRGALTLSEIDFVGRCSCCCYCSLRERRQGEWYWRVNANGIL